MTDSTGQSAADHEGTDLEPDKRDDEVLTMTRRQLRIIVHGMLNLGRIRHQPRKNYVRLDTVTPEEIAR